MTNQHTTIGYERLLPDYPGDELTAEQLGHLRHFDNLSRQLPNDWSLMQGKHTGQDDFGTYRFQLAYTAYALALAHVHRLPAAPGVFKPIYQRLMDKMLLPEVWMYWKDTSRGGMLLNAHLDLREEWDPVVRDNIMYSAYVQSMALLFNYLFDDDRYAQPGALTFRHFSFFWGGPEKRFEYDQNSLNEHIYWQMVESGYLGVACEPNCVFQICNQPAILGFRMHDLLTEGNVAEEVTRGYEQAWQQFGRLDETGRYNQFVVEDSKMVVGNPQAEAWVDAWCGSLMNMWNRDFVHANYPRQVRDLLIPGTDGALAARKQPQYPELVGDERTDGCDFGWVAVWASEMGDEETLRGLLTHADRYMAPTWRDGGLYYPRHDEMTDEHGHQTEMEPLTGNVLLGYARLNVPDGLWRLYNRPWDRGHFRQPALVEVASDVDVTRAFYDPERRTLAITLSRREDRRDDGLVLLDNVGGPWTLYSDDRVVGRGGLGRDLETAGGPTLRWEGDKLALRCPPGGPHRFTMVFDAAGNGQGRS